MSKRFLVTGGAGFIGSHLCEHLHGAGHHVLCVDNLSTGRKENLANLLGKPRFDFVKHDIIVPLDWAQEVDFIYNLACPASPVHYQKNPIDTFKSCVLGTLNILELARKFNARALQASTSEVYGEPEIHPQPESYVGHVNCVGPRACYDEGKRATETLVFDYQRVYNVDIRVVRIFNTYGPRMLPNDGRVVSDFIVKALQGETLHVYGTGKQTRSFCYVDDLLDGMMTAMADHSPAGPINLGNPAEVSILELANRILALTKSSSTIQYCATRQDDPTRRQPDITLARQVLGFSPKISLEEGLKQTIQYLRNHIL